MTKEKELTTPPDFKGLIIYWFDQKYQSSPNWIKRPIKILLFGLSPDIPTNFSNFFRNTKDKKAFFLIWAITFFFCFVVNLILSARNNTLYGIDPSRLYFIQDWADLLEYTILCPTHVAVASLLIVEVFRGITDLNVFNDSLQSKMQLDIKSNNKPEYYKSFNIPATLFISFLISTVSTISFMKESLDINNYAKYFWYVEHITPNGEQILGSFGLYYTFLNFALGYFVVFAFLMYLRIFVASIQIGKSISKIEATSKLQFNDLKKGLTPFINGYLYAKILALLYMFNWYTWQWSNPKNSINVVAFGLALLIVGVFIISIPRYFIQLKWYQLTVRQAKYKRKNSIIAYEDIRPKKVIYIVSLIDILFGIAFITSLWDYISSNFLK